MRQRFVLMIALAVVSLLTVAGIMRSVSHAQRMRQHVAPTIRPWMTIPVIAHSYHVEPNAVHAVLNLPLDEPDDRPLWQIARDQGRTPAQLINELETSLRANWNRPARPAGPPPSPPPQGAQ